MDLLKVLFKKKIVFLFSEALLHMIRMHSIEDFSVNYTRGCRNGDKRTVSWMWSGGGN